MKIKFSRCKSNNLKTVPQVDGQLTFTKDTDEIYLDVGQDRKKISDIIFIDTISNRNKIVNPLPNKLYYVAETNYIYHYDGSKWVEPKSSAETSDYDNTNTQIQATTVQGAVTELDNKVGDISSVLDKINGNEGGNK